MERNGLVVIGLALCSVVAFSSSGCRRTERRPTPSMERDVSSRDAAPRRADSASSTDAAEAPNRPETKQRCIHQRRADLGAPVHRKRGGGGGFSRLEECTQVRIIEGDERWFKIAFPLVDDRTEGWISHRYLMSCDACAGDSDADVGVGDGGQAWPPAPVGQCATQGASGRERFEVAEVEDEAEVNGGAAGVPGVGVTVLSYNLWELYDGRGEERYLAAEQHGGTPREQYERRLRLFARALRSQEVDVLLLQEVESAEVACALAAQAWPRSGWSCFATEVPYSMPQNIAIATRLKGQTRRLHPLDGRAAGPRDALELSLEGAGGLTLTTVHLKSSRGAQGPEDCANARRRMGAAVGLARRYEGRPSVLVAGDFNVDPLDRGRAIYDRTDDILLAKGFERLCSKQGCDLATYPSSGSKNGSSRGSAVDLVFFRGGGVWSVGALEVLGEAPRGRQAPLGSDHLPLVIRLQRR